MGEVIGGQEGGFLQAGAFYHRIRLLRRQRRTDFLYVTAALQQWRRDAPFRAGPRRRADTSRVTCASVGVLRMQRTADAEGNAGERARGPPDENKNQSVNRM